jgi:hypothetical protein
MQNIRHQSLETHIFNTSDKFGGLEVLVGRIPSTLPQVINQIPGIRSKYTMHHVTRETSLGDFAQSTAFFTEVYNKTNTTALSATDAFFDSEHKVRLASTNVRTEHVGSITCEQSSVSLMPITHVGERYTYIRHAHVTSTPLTHREDKQDCRLQTGIRRNLDIK